MPGLDRYTKLGPKYRVYKRNEDGTFTLVEYPTFVLGARDECTALALTGYLQACQQQGRDPEYIGDIQRMAEEFEEYRATHGQSAPDQEPHSTTEESVPHDSSHLSMMNAFAEQLSLSSSAFAEQVNHSNKMFMEAVMSNNARADALTSTMLDRIMKELNKRWVIIGLCAILGSWIGHLLAAWVIFHYLGR